MPFRGDFVLNRGPKALNQTDDQNDERYANHHAEDGEKAAQLVGAHGVEGELKIFAEVLCIAYPKFRPAALRWGQVSAAHMAG